MPNSWLGILREIFVSTFGPTWGPVMMGLFAGAVFLYAVMPILVFILYSRSRRMLAQLTVAVQRLEGLTRQHAEVTALVKESSALVKERLCAIPPPVRFGPESPAVTETPGAPPPEKSSPDVGGQGVYNFCPSCKAIQFIKFSRCQTCGFHVLPPK